jgi:eukaryotic-like serine/threonine-protein kinase
MTPERWQKIEQLCNAALEREASQRGTFLAQACQGDDELRREVESLLAQEKPAERFLESVGAEVSRKVWAKMQGGDGERSMIGRQLGSYQVVSLLGAGGMGEVYQARDTKLSRDVAVKVLPAGLIHDADRLARFQREARMLAALNHPNIATIHGLEQSNGTHYLVMELVPGETLAQRISRGALPVQEALKVGVQIAEALEAAHEKGVIHRDLKPANVKVTPEGRVKVLDFGLAKAFAGDSAQDLSQLPTLTAMGTEEGRILGTPAYMSPEQARGKAVDKRTDIWAFGCVFYELLTGRAAFRGETVSDTIAAILEREPAWDRLPEATPPTVRRLLRRCLEKEPKRRLRDIGDARIELEDALASPAQEHLAPEKPMGMTRRQAISALAGVAAGAASTGIFAIRRYRDATPRNLTRFAIAMAEGEFYSPSFNRRVAISPDGTHVAFSPATASSVDPVFYMRSLNELESKRVKDIVGGGPFFSPDGKWIGFMSLSLNYVTGVQKLALSGGAPVTICAADGFAGATWADGDTIYFVADIPGGVLSVPAAGGQPKEIVKIDFDKGERQHKYPCALPGGKAVLSTVTTAGTATFDEARIGVFSPETGERKVLVEGGTHPLYLRSGYLLYAHDGKILAIRFDAQRLETMGQPFPVLDGVLMSRNTGVANYDVSGNGDLVYVPGICDGGARTLVWVDRNGKAEPLPLGAKSYLHPRLSPDDRRLAIEVEGPSHDLYVYDFDRGVLANITTDGVSHWPVWSPDGMQLSYRSGPMGKWSLWRVPADRSRPPQQVPATGIAQSAESWSPDSRVIAYTAFAPGVPPNIMVAHLDGRQAELFAQEKAPEGSPKFSPDGRWLAYCSNESGKPQVYVQAFPGPGPKIQVSTEGGTDPVWQRSGGELYYRNGDSMMAVPVSTAPTFKPGRPQQLWKGHYSHGMSSSCGPPGTTSSNYDVTADGKRFLMIKDDDQDSAISRQIVVVLNWADEVRRLSAKI